MKKYPVLIIGILLAVLFGCTTPSKLQTDLSTYYNMVYKIGQDACTPIAESFLEEQDRVLILHTGQGFEGVGARYWVDEKNPEEPDGDPYEYDRYMADYPYFIEYIEDGFINSVMEYGGVGFERMKLPYYMNDYVNQLLENDYIFNTSILEYNWWEELADEFDVDKVLVYDLHNIIQKDVDYMGVQLGMKFIDVANGGRVLYDSIDNVYSSGFPDSKKTLLRKFFLEIPGDAVEAFGGEVQNVIDDEGLDADGGLDVVLVKTDDIPSLGSYPITQEDFYVEMEMNRKLGGLENLNVLEKLYKRQYKADFQLINAVNHINPFRGGEYSEFENYYGTPYMLAYKVLFDQQTGKYDDTKDVEIDLKEKILGIYVKLIDMSDKGRILLTHFIPLTTQQKLDGNFLYTCFTKMNNLDQIGTAIDENFALSPEEDHAVLINKRMEIFRNYLIREFPAYKSMFGTVNSNVSADILKEYDLIYKLFNIEERDKVKGDIYYIMAAHLMNGWFEEGITDYLVRNGYMIHEKLESLYSRYLITYNWGGSNVDDDIFLSPIKLKQWDADDENDINNFYGLQKVIYFIPMEKKVAGSDYITPDKVTSEATAIELSQFYPNLSHQLEWLLFSVLDVQKGDYSLNRNFNIAEGGE